MQIFSINFNYLKKIKKYGQIFLIKNQNILFHCLQDSLLSKFFYFGKKYFSQKKNNFFLEKMENN
jgi:hypothetical protein